MKLYLGFEDFPYTARYSQRSPLTATTKKRAPKVMTHSQQAYGAGKTTVEVANELEAKYNIVETFWDMEEDKFAEVLEEAYSDAIEDVMQMKGQTRGVTAFVSKETDKIEARFRQNLTSRRYDGVIAGVPTTAAQRGVSHLYQKPYAKRPPRPSFIDTGMYQRSFRAWVEDVEEDL